MVARTGTTCSSPCELFHVDYVVIRHRSAVAVVQGISGRASRWKDTLKPARKAAAKLVPAYPRHP
ncbi:UNVERIFIED_ORG: hypothetical protein FHR35_000534 [Microbispora rosea subsp. rosea]